MQAFDLDFAHRYLGNLHGHLTGARISKPWKRHYELSAGTACGLARVTAAAFNAHLTVDLAEASAAARSGPQHLDDYLMISGQIIQTAGQAMAAVQQADGVPLMPGIGPQLRPSVVQRLFYQAIAPAFVNGLALRSRASRGLVRPQIHSLWWARDATADRLATTGLL